jgi:tetratricopeptide (TPR) repeat protein
MRIRGWRGGVAVRSFASGSRAEGSRCGVLSVFLILVSMSHLACRSSERSATQAPAAALDPLAWPVEVPFALAGGGRLAGMPTSLTTEGSDRQEGREGQFPADLSRIPVAFVARVEAERSARTPRGFQLSAALAAARQDWKRARNEVETAQRVGLEEALAASDLAALDLAAAASGADVWGELSALVETDRALASAPRLEVALWNRATVLTRLGLVESAARAWDVWREVRPAEVAARDLRPAAFTESSCANLAAWRNWLERPVEDLPPTFGGNAGAGSVATDAARPRVEELQALRLLFEDELLPAAQVDRDRRAPEGARLLRAASVLSEGLRAAGVDVLPVPAGGEADALAAYSAARQSYRTLDYERCVARFDGLLGGSASLAPGIVGRARFYRAACLHRVERKPEAAAEFAVLAQGAPSLARAMALWKLADLELESGSPRTALPLYERSREELVQANEWASVATLDANLGGVLLDLGDAEAAWRKELSALRLAPRTCHAATVGGVVYAAGRVAARLGSTSGSAAFQAESAALERRSGQPELEAETWREMAVVAENRGRPEEATRLLGEARSALARAASPAVRERRARVLDLIEGTLLAARDPQAGEALLSRALAGITGPPTADGIAGRVARGSVRARRGDLEAARADFLQAVVEQERRVDDAARSAASDDSSDPAVARAFDTWIDVEMQAGEPERALEIAERARRLVNGERGAGGGPGVSRGNGRGSVPALRGLGRLRGDVALLYLDQTDNGLHVWFRRGAERRAWTLPWSRGELRRRVSALEAFWSGDEDSLQRFADAVLAPVETEIRTLVRLVVVTDDALGGVPWPAIPDARGGRWNDHLVVSVAPSFTAAVGEGPLDAGAGARALIVADPMRGGGEPPLPASREEALQIAAFYSAPEILVGRAATVDQVLARWASRDVLHLAVHALVDEELPENSRLLFASGAATNTPDGLRPMQIRAARFTRRPLVILSACDTQRGRLFPLSGAASLVRALLAGGASGVVATLRPVEDRAAAELMTAMHRHRVRSGRSGRSADTAEALALAVRETDLPVSVWAAFQYVGADPGLRRSMEEGTP